MTYNPNIPQAGDRPSSSQGDILMNFQELNSQFSINHTPLISSSNNGKHTRVDMPPQSPAPTPAGLDGVLYTADVSGETQLFFANSAGIDQLTGSSGGTNFLAAINGWCSLAGPIILNWGRLNIFGTSNQETFTFARPFAVDPYAVVAMSGLTNVPGLSNTVVTKVSSTSATVRLNANNSNMTPPSNRVIHLIAVGLG